MLIFLI